MKIQETKSETYFAVARWTPADDTVLVGQFSVWEAAREEQAARGGRVVRVHRITSWELAEADLPAMAWRAEPPDTPGFWWLYGDEEFGVMGGNYTGAFPPDIRLQLVDVQQLGDSLQGVVGGRFITLRPFDKENHVYGYVGVWQKAVLPDTPVNSEPLV